MSNLLQIDATLILEWLVEDNHMQSVLVEVQRYIVQHKILHALGRIHEQSQPDRDRYVVLYSSPKYNEGYTWSYVICDRRVYSINF